MSEPATDLISHLVKARNRSGRCTYDKAAKRELVRRCLQPGVSLARTALEHCVNANLLRKWVQQQTGAPAPTQRAIRTADAPAALVAVRTVSAPPSPPAHDRCHLEIVVAGGTIRIFDAVDAMALSVALSCLARQP